MAEFTTVALKIVTFSKDSHYPLLKLNSIQFSSIYSSKKYYINSLMTGYLQYSKAKTTGSTLYLTKTKIFETKHIYEIFKTTK